MPIGSLPAFLTKIHGAIPRWNSPVDRFQSKCTAMLLSTSGEDGREGRHVGAALVCAACELLEHPSWAAAQAPRLLPVPWIALLALTAS